MHAFSGAPLAEAPWEDDAEAAGEGEASDYASVTVEVPELCPALHRPGVHRSDAWPLAAVAEGAAGRGRPAADQQRRRHHQLRDAAHRAAAARVRPRSGAGRRVDHPHRGRRREDDHARRGRAHLRRRGGPGLRPRRALGHRRDHGRSGVGGLRVDHPRPARGCDLERGQHPAHLPKARPAVGGVQPVREAASSGARDTRPAHRLTADGGAVRSEARARDDRRRRGAAARAPGADARAPCRVAARDADRAGALRHLPGAARLRGRARRRRPDRRGSLPPPLRRQPGGRPGGGGGAHSRLRRAPPRHPAAGEKPGRAVDARAGVAPPRRGRDAGSGLRRRRQPEPRRPGPSGAAAPARG